MWFGSNKALKARNKPFFGYLPQSLNQHLFDKHLNTNN